MPATYEPIATTTLGSAAASITLSSIPATYTDLRLVVVMQVDTTNTCFFQYNSDTGSNYSETILWGNGSTANSFTAASRTRIPIGGDIVSASTTLPFLAEIDVFSYAGSTNKTTLVSTSEDFNGSGVTRKQVNLWRNTAAITSITLGRSAGNYKIGTTATLYGIKSA
jgi:hypothetical protein